MAHVVSFSCSLFMILVPLVFNRCKAWWYYYKHWSQTVLMSIFSTYTLCLYFRGITLQAESKKEYEEVKIFLMLLFLHTNEPEDFSFIFLFQWICAINNISRQIYLTDNPEVGVASIFQSIPSTYSPIILQHSKVNYMSRRAVLSCFHRQLQSN